MVKQAHKLMGIPGGHGNFFYQAWHVIKFLTRLNPWTCAIAGAAILTMFLLGAIAPRVPSALVVLVLGILSSSLFGLQAHGVEMVGTIQAGMPSPTLPRVVGADAANLFIGTFDIVLVGGGSGSSLSRNRHCGSRLQGSNASPASGSQHVTTSSTIPHFV
jgi:sulfate permease, SulP family